MTELSQLLERARDGDARFFLVFGGQGSGWFKELHGYYQDPAIRPLIELCVEAMREELPYLEPGVALPHGLDVLAWLRDETTIPTPEYLACAGVSVPLIFVTQLAVLASIQQHGGDLAELLRYTVGSSGQSQGLCTASMLSLGRGVRDPDTVRQWTKLLFFIGTRAQEVYPSIEPTADEREQSAAVNDWRNASPTPMVAVVGAPPALLRQRLSWFNSKMGLDRQIHVSLSYTSERVVLSGHRSALIAFNAWNRSVFAEHGIKYVYIRTTCPFHCAMMTPIRPRLEADLARIGLRYPGRALQLPVYSFSDGRNLQHDAEIAVKLYLDVLINPLDWRKALAPVPRLPVTHVIDIGPGNENRHISRQVLAEIGCQTPILSARALLRSRAETLAVAA